jgi:hypothetical protein
MTFHHQALAQIEAQTYRGWSYNDCRAGRSILRERMMRGSPVTSDAELDRLVTQKLGHSARYRIAA